MRITLFDYCKNNNKEFLLEEWDYELNDAINLFVDKVSYGSAIIANWICKNHHRYQRRIAARTSNNSKCPYCESRKQSLLLGYNDFATTYPNLLLEWDYTKNTEIDPHKILPTSTKKVWWICIKCHNTWQAAIRQRTKIGQGCPYCAHLKPIVGINDFQTMFPELIKDWDYKKNPNSPDTYSAFSGMPVWWKCHYCGHEWRTAINNRTTNKRNCPACSMKQTSFGEQAVYYYVKQIFPDAINRFRSGSIELDVFIPSIKTAIEYDGLFWHNNETSIQRDQKKYSFCRSQGIKLIRIRDSKAKIKVANCDYGIGIENLEDKNNLKKVIRWLLKDLDPASNILFRKNPFQFWSSIDSKVNIDNDRYAILQDKYLREKKNSFVSLYPEIAEEWNYSKNQSFNPTAFPPCSTIKVWWKCKKCNEEWQAKIVDRTTGHSVCPVCSNKKLREGYNDFATLYPYLLEEWNYSKNDLLPNKIAKRGRKKIWWICKKCGHEWQATIADRTRPDKPSGCPKCKITNMSLTKHLKAIARGTLNETNPEILEEWDYEKNTVLLSETTKGANIYVWRKCKYCGHSWQTSINNWTRLRARCPKCKHKEHAT